MSTIGAYVELKTGENPFFHSESRWAEGELNSRGPEGLDVDWWDEYPEDAQVYLVWEPRVFAVWEEENDSGGSEVEQPGAEVPGDDGSVDGGDDPDPPTDDGEYGSGGGSSDPTGGGTGEEPVARPEETEPGEEPPTAP